MNSIANVFEENVNVIVSNEEVLGLYALKYISNLAANGKINKLLLINIDQDSLDFFIKSIPSNKLLVNPALTEVENFINSYPSISIGVSLFSPEFDALKKAQSQAIIFINSLGIFKDSFTRQYKNVQFVESTFTDFVKASININVKAEPKMISTQSTSDFVNREAERRDIEAFEVENKYRAIKIVGMPGMGKRALFNHLRLTDVTNSNYFEFYFQDEYDTLNDVLSVLFVKFGVDIKLEDSGVYDLRDQHTKDLMKRFFRAFDALRIAKIIFYNIHLIYDINKGVFKQNEFANFYKQLLLRQTYSGNKVYFISDVNFQFEPEVENVIKDQVIHGLTASHIKQLMQNEFDAKNNKAFGKTVASIEDSIIENLCGGHPQIAKLFTRVAENYGVDNLINDNDLAKLFKQEHKVKYLVSKIEITHEERALLMTLSLFTEDVDFDFIKKNFKSIHLLESLINKFLLEKIVYSGGRVKYYVPTLIKDVVLVQANEEELIKNHNIIGDYYWNISEDLISDLIEGYRKSFYHYLQAKNNEKVKLLTLRFKGNIVQKATLLFKKRHFEKAWILFDDLYKKQLLTDPNSIIKYLETEINLNKKSEGTESKISEAIQEYPNVDYLKQLRAKHLFNIGDFETSKSQCETLIGKSFPTKNNKLNSLYIKCLFKLNFHKKASELLNHWINKLESEVSRNASLKFTLLLTYVILAEYKLSQLENIKSVAKIIIRNLETFKIDFTELHQIIEYETEYTQPIISKFEQCYLASVKCCEAYITYLSRKKRFHKINEIIERAKNGMKVREKDFSENKILSIKEKATHEHNLFFYVQNKMSQVLEHYFNDKDELIHYKSSLKGKVAELISIAEKAEALRLKEENTFESIAIEIMQYAEDFINLERIIELSDNESERKSFINSLNRNILYVEGETDELYLKTAARILERNHINIEIRWIGYFDNKGNVSFSGDTALNQTYSYYLANKPLLPKNEKVILLYDSDTKKPSADHEDLFVRCMKNNSENKLFKIGIENLLTLPENFDVKKFYSESIKYDDYGARSIINKLDKKALCNHICNEVQIKHQKNIFKKFQLIFDDIESIISV